MIKELIKLIFNSTSFLIISQKFVQAIIGLVTTILVTFFLSPIEQGYFYTMGSILTSYVLLDLGLSNLVVQKSAGYFSALKWGKNNIIIGNKLVKAKFISFFKCVETWYIKLSFLTFIILPVGYLYFSNFQSTNDVNWILPWLIGVLFFALSMPAIGYLALMEGSKQIRSVYKIRIAHYLFGGFLSWILLYIGQGIYSLAAAPFAIIIIVYLWIYTKFNKFIIEIKKHENIFSWKNEIYPQQKKVGVNWLSNYFFLHLPVPIVFYFLGPIDAGKFGLSIVVANISISIAMAPITSITPKISSLLSQANFDKGLYFFIKAFIFSLILILLGSCFFFFIHSVFQNIHFFQRLLSPTQLLLIFISFSFYYFVNSFIIFFRSYGKEPFVFQILITTVLMITIGSYLINDYGIDSFIFMVLISYIFLFIYCLIYFINFINSFKKI